MAAVARPLDHLRRRAEQEDDQAVPHPQQAPILEYGGVGRLLKEPVDEAEQAARPGYYSFPADKCFQVVGQRRSRCITLPRRLFQAFETNGFEVARYAGIEQPRRHRVLLENQHQCVEGSRRLKWRPAGQTFVKDGAQSVNIRGRRQLLLRPRLFGRHVAWRADNRAGLSQAADRVQQLRQSEVRDFWRAGSVSDRSF